MERGRKERKELNSRKVGYNEDERREIRVERGRKDKNKGWVHRGGQRKQIRIEERKNRKLVKTEKKEMKTSGKREEREFGRRRVNMGYGRREGREEDRREEKRKNQSW